MPGFMGSRVGVAERDAPGLGEVLEVRETLGHSGLEVGEGKAGYWDGGSSTRAEGLLGR